MFAKIRSRNALPSASMLVALCALVTAAGGVAVAAIPHSATAVITGCYGPATSLRVIDAQAGQICKSEEKTLTWNQQGKPGPAGVIGSVVVRRTDVLLPAGAAVDTAGAPTSGFATCAAGEKLIGGSANVSNANDPPTQEIMISRPSTNNVDSGTVPDDGGTMAFWKGTGRALTNVDGAMRIFAFCATA